MLRLGNKLSGGEGHISWRTILGIGQPCLLRHPQFNSRHCCDAMKMETKKPSGIVKTCVIIFPSHVVFNLLLLVDSLSNKQVLSSYTTSPSYMHTA